MLAVAISYLANSIFYMALSLAFSLSLSIHTPTFANDHSVHLILSPNLLLRF
jgi:hypothetical protein